MMHQPSFHFVPSCALLHLVCTRACGHKDYNHYCWSHTGDSACIWTIFHIFLIILFEPHIQSGVMWAAIYDEVVCTRNIRAHLHIFTLQGCYELDLASCCFFNGIHWQIMKLDWVLVTAHDSFSLSLLRCSAKHVKRQNSQTAVTNTNRHIAVCPVSRPFAWCSWTKAFRCISVKRWCSISQIGPCNYTQTENGPLLSEVDILMLGRKLLSYSPCKKQGGTSLFVSIRAGLIIPQRFKWQADKVKLISILHLKLIHSVETRCSRSAAVEELLAASHKKELHFLFLFGGAKKRRCAAH